MATNVKSPMKRSQSLRPNAGHSSIGNMGLFKQVSIPEENSSSPPHGQGVPTAGSHSVADFISSFSPTKPLRRPQRPPPQRIRRQHLPRADPSTSATTPASARPPASQTQRAQEEPPAIVKPVLTAASQCDEVALSSCGSKANTAHHTLHPTATNNL